MAYNHGIITREIPTSLVPPARIEAGLPFVVGTAPVHLSGELKNVNKPVLCYSYAEFVKAFGYSKEWDKYTLCEFAHSQFVQHNVAPVVFVNVLDPVKHSTPVAATTYTITDGQVDLGKDVLGDSLTVTEVADENPATYELGTDYIVAYDDDGNAVLSVVPDGAIASATSVKIAFTKIDASAVDDDDVIGGVDRDGNNTGLMLTENVYPKFRLTIGLIAAPKFSQSSVVAAVMRTRAESVNGVFSGGLAIVDIPSGEDGAKCYTDVPEWKTRHNFMSEHMVCCWPKIRLGDYEYHLSTQLIGIMNKVDADHGGIPYKSPSNELLQMDACVNAAGDEINLGVSQAAYLNGQGIVTAINFANGWVAWGNRTACYPGVTDPKDAFIPVRRMFTFLRNEFTLTFWQKIDDPITKRLIKTILDSYQTRLNSLQAMEAILGGRIEFLETENALTDLIDGILHFHIYVTPPTPAKEIQAAFEFDPAYFNTLFE